MQLKRTEFLPLQFENAFWETQLPPNMEASSQAFSYIFWNSVYLVPSTFLAIHGDASNSGITRFDT